MKKPATRLKIICTAALLLCIIGFIRYARVSSDMPSTLTGAGHEVTAEVSAAPEKTNATDAALAKHGFSRAQVHPISVGVK